MQFGIRHFWRRVRRSVVAAATVAAVAACAIGVPYRAPVQKSHAERFPCENHACGCPDAATCWRDCCCMTDAAKLAWAKQAGVEPPAFVVAAAAVETHREVHEHEHGDAECLASDSCGTSSCGASSYDASATKTCCSAKVKKTCCNSGTHREHMATVPTRGVKLIQLMAAMKCRGLSVSVAMLPPSLAVDRTELFPHVIERYEAAPSDSNLYDGPSLAVDSPPPQVCCA